MLTSVRWGVRQVVGWGLGVLGVLCTGCGSGGGEGAAPARTVEPNLLSVSFAHSRILLQQQQYQEESYSTKVRYWVPKTTAPLTGVQLECPALSGGAALPGPYAPAATDGINGRGVPIWVYWGGGTTVTSGQPVKVAVNAQLPGYRPPDDALRVYLASKEQETPYSIAGDFTLRAATGVLGSWQLPAPTAMLPAPEMTFPTFIGLNSLQPFQVHWKEVPGAVGYFINIEGNVEDTAGTAVRHVVWTSASTPVLFEVLFDHRPYLLSADTRSITVPARIFRGCKGAQIDVIAIAAPLEDAATTPTLRVSTASILSQFFVFYEQ
jgi:hypothetical protein